MSELKNLIHSEVADFFAAFGSHGEPDVESGEAQKKLTARIDSLIDADIARRGAAVGEPIGEVRLGDYEDDGLRPATVACLHEHAGWENFPDGTKLYTAAQPAALPPEMKEENAAYQECKHGLSTAFMEGYNQCRADAKSLGCQSEKVVKLPARFKPKMSSLLGKNAAVMQCTPEGGWVNLNVMKAALDAAGVKYETTPPADG